MTLLFWCINIHVYVVLSSSGICKCRLKNINVVNLTLKILWTFLNSFATKIYLFFSKFFDSYKHWAQILDFKTLKALKWCVVILKEYTTIKSILIKRPKHTMNSLYCTGYTCCNPGELLEYFFGKQVPTKFNFAFLAI